MCGDLLTIQQCKGELLRQYIQHFSWVRNTIPRISLAAIIMAFSEGVTSKWLVGNLETQNVEIVAELFTLVDKCTRETEAAQSQVKRRSIPEEPVSRTQQAQSQEEQEED